MDRFPTFVQKGTYGYTTAGLEGEYGKSRDRGSKAYIEVADWNYLIRELGKINKELYKEMKRDFKEAAKPVKNEIARSIRASGIGRSQMRGFKKAVIPGRVTWGSGKPAASAIIALPRVNAKKGKFQIVRISVASPATIIADMAGKSNRATNAKAYTDVYPYSLSPSGVRSHKITITGSRKFILNLNAAIGGRASRMIYPGAEKAQPAATDEIGQIVGKALATINRRLKD